MSKFKSVEMSDSEFKRILKSNGFLDIEVRYFTQDADEKPALKTINRKLSDSKAMTILDIGCGIGLVEKSVLKEKPNVIIVGLDIKKRFLRVANDYVDSNFILADGRFLPFKDNFFDCIVVHDVCLGLNLYTILNELSRVFTYKDELFFDLPNCNFYDNLSFLLPFPNCIAYNYADMEKRISKYDLQVTCRSVVAFSRESRIKFKIPKSLNLALDSGLRLLPVKMHVILSKYWFLTLFICRRKGSTKY